MHFEVFAKFWDQVNETETKDIMALKRHLFTGKWPHEMVDRKKKLQNALFGQLLFTVLFGRFEELPNGTFSK